MRAMRIGLLALAIASTGCAAIFRDSSQRVHFESAPAGARAVVKGKDLGVTPNEAEVDRGGLTVVSYRKEGYQEHTGLVRKKVSGAWLALDIILCPVTICIPLIVDGVSGAWNNVPPTYTATLDPMPGQPARPPPVATAPALGSTQAAPPAAMSESERKATARAAYMEGAALQEKGDCHSALSRFEAAQKLYDAPTHVLRMAQCQAQTGKLVEAQESYETLVHANLGAQPPDAFKQAQETAKKELAVVRPRVPSLRVQITPPPATLSALLVQMNGRHVPNELLGIARPMNPGTYKVVVSARDMRTVPIDLELREGEQRVLQVPLSR